MTLFSFAKHFSFHLLAASIAWVCFALIGERLVPGFALPFVDIGLVALAIGILASLYLVVQTRGTLFGRFVSIILLAALLIMAIVLVAVHFAPLDGRDTALLVVAVVLGAGSLYAFLVE